MRASLEQAVINGYCLSRIPLLSESLTMAVWRNHIAGFASFSVCLRSLQHPCSDLICLSVSAW